MEFCLLDWYSIVVENMLLEKSWKACEIASFSDKDMHFQASEKTFIVIRFLLQRHPSSISVYNVITIILRINNFARSTLKV